MRKLTVSPDTIVRFKLGKIWLHRGAEPGRSMASNQPDLAHLVSSFAAPRAPEEVVSLYPPQTQQAVGGMIQRLHEAGILIDAAETPAEEGNLRRETDEAARLLADLANSVYGIASDLRGLGPYAQAKLAERSGSDVLSRVLSALAAVDSLASDLHELKDDYLRAQLESLDIRPDTEHLKLHVGAGENDLPGWVNVDIYPAQLAMNIKWGLPFADGTADYVFMSHFFEHLFYPEEALGVLEDVYRVLASHGVMRIIVPDIEKCLRAYVDDDENFFASRRDTWSWWPERQTRLEDFLAYAGAGPDPGRLFDAHKYGYDFETLAHLLRRAGFTRVERSDYMGSAHETLRVDDASLVAGAKYGDEYYSLFVEATK